MKALREYKMSLSRGVLRAQIDEDGNWQCEVKGAPEWRPVQKSDEPIWIDNRRWEKIPEKLGVKDEQWATFRKEVQEQEALIENAKEKAPDIDERIKRVGDNILKNGDVVKLLVRQAQRNHKGDTDVIKHLLASVASTNSTTSSGIQPGITGEKGGGKTDCARAVFHLIPEDWKLDASVTAKIPFYLPMKDGLIIFSDDVEWSPELIHTLKRAMGRFQTRQKHLTLDTDRNPVEKEMAARLAWWLSSVESVADDQLIDRQYSLDVDDDFKHANEVSNYIRNSRARKVVRYDIDWRVEVARYILQQVKEHEPFKVIIPCAEKASWKIIKDHRTQQKFWDLVEAFAILRFSQRHIDEDGWLYATREDFDEAVGLFGRRKANHQTHLTNAQTEIVRAVIDLQGEDGTTQAEIARILQKSQQAVSKGLKAVIANTPFLLERKGQHGELIYEATVHGLEVLYKEGFVSLPDDYNDSQPPFNPLTTNLTTNKTNNNNNNYITLQHDSQESKGKILDEEKKNSSYSQENGCKVVKSALDSDNACCGDVVLGCKCSTDSGIKAELKSVEDDRGEWEAKFRTPVKLKVVYFLAACPMFVGVDGRNYGPFQPDEVASLPEIQANGLIQKSVVRGLN